MRASSRLATTYAMLHELDLERVLPGAGALLSGAY
jgi:maleate isomerase